MLRAAVLAATLLQANGPEVECPAQPERIFLGAVATNPDAYRYRVVEVCGNVEPMRGGGPGERVLHDTSRYGGDGYWIYVHDPESALPPPGGRTCVVGRPWRRDGFTAEEATARGRTNYRVTDALQRPDYVFYPVQCTYDGPALG